MMKPIRIALVLTVLVVALLSGLASYRQWQGTTWPDDVVLTVNMLDVGQGDAIHIRDAHGIDMLIDGGRGDAVLQQLSRTMPWSDRTIEYVLLTHPDADHVEGLAHVLDRYRVETIVTTDNRAGTRVDTAYNDRWARAADIQEIHEGFTLNGNEWSLNILWPQMNCIGVHETASKNIDCEHERNDRSVVAMLHTSNVRTLLTGDIEREAEKALLELYTPEDLQADILKVAHHGSTTSSYVPLLQAIQPTNALISAGADNSYGHPHMSTIQRLDTIGARTWRTDLHGTVQCRIYKSEGYECRSLVLW